MTFREQLRAASARNRSFLCIGLDPQLERLPVPDVLTFTRAIIEATSDLVCAYKPQSAFFEAMGSEGWAALRDTIRAVPADIPVILDVKRGDVAHTAEAYAEACFDVLGAHAVTISPYLGGDSVAPFLARPDRASFILCRTSNPGASDLQDLRVHSPDGGEPEPLYLRVATLARQWEAGRGNVGLVVGATYPHELASVRERCPDLPLLIPGVGTQGGDLGASVAAGLDATSSGIVINASRSVIYASSGADFATAARAEAQRLRDAINVACADAQHQGVPQ